MCPKNLSNSQMRLYNSGSERLYLNAAERTRFEAAVRAALPLQTAFGLTLLYTGCRLSEALELSSGSVQRKPAKITFRTLKRRRRDIFREVPVPDDLALQLLELSRQPPHAQDGKLFLHFLKPLRRITAYRWIKILMVDAEIYGAQACPKGLRHSFGIHALQSGVPLNLLQKWMGHAAMSTTAIYANASGPEERLFAQKMWTGIEEGKES